jgi:hypothetical protein
MLRRGHLVVQQAQTYFCLTFLLMCYVGKELWIIVFLKQTKNQNDDLRFIYLKITVDRKSVELSTKRKCEQARWNSQSGRATGIKESYISETMSVNLTDKERRNSALYSPNQLIPYPSYINDLNIRICLQMAS